MEIAAAQRDVRLTYLGGFFGQLVSAALWLASAAVATSGATRAAILLLTVGGVFIFPVTSLLLKLTGRPAGLPAGHPMNQLGTQVAMTLPLTIPLVAGAALYRLEWFYPAFMVALGAHYLPFAFLYGMRMFVALAAALIGAGVALALWIPSGFAAGAYVTAGVLVLAAFAGRALVARELAAG